MKTRQTNVDRGSIQSKLCCTFKMILFVLAISELTSIFLKKTRGTKLSCELRVIL